MNQSYIPDINFFKERSFESSNNSFKIKADRIFGRLFGDSEYIPASFKIENGVILTKDKTENNNGQLIISYLGIGSNLVINVYL